MNPAPILIGLSIFLGLLAGTTRTIKRNLVRRPAEQTPLGTVAFCSWVEVSFWFLALVAFVFSAPHPATFVLALVFALSLIYAGRMRYAEERQSLNRWLRLSSKSQVSIPLLLDELADGCRSGLARRAKACVKRLNRGEDLAEAARRAKMPLDADTITAIMVPDQDELLAGNSVGTVSIPASEYREGRQAFSVTSGVLLVQQFAYLVVTVVLAWLIGWLVRSQVLPLIKSLSRESSFGLGFGRQPPAFLNIENVAWMGDVFMIFFSGWLLLGMIVRDLPAMFVGWVPWFGRRAIDGWRCEILGALARGTRSGQAELSIMECATRSARDRWVKKRCHKICVLVESGVPLPTALRRVKLISTREEGWLTIAHANGTLPNAFEKLVSDIQRWMGYRWRIRMGWLVPLLTVLVGLFVLAHALHLFLFLAEIVNGLSF